MAYLDIISLESAKNYLKIDDTLSEDDSLITKMIEASLFQLERQTNLIFFSKEKSYVLFNDYVDVYDYPINSVISTESFEISEHTMFTTYVSKESDKVVLNVGFNTITDIPQDLIQVAYKLIDVMYYNRKEGLGMYDKMVIDSHRRFTI